MKKITEEERKATDRARSAKRRKEHPGKVKESKRRYEKENTEKIKKQRARYRKENTSAEHNRSAKWRKENPEKYRKWFKENKEKLENWNKNNKEKRRGYWHNHKARKLLNGGKLSPGLEAKLLVLQRDRCAVCKKNLKKIGHHMDHIVPLVRGGKNVDSNIQLTCPRCNQEKGAKDPIVFMQGRGFLL
jgi:5-methylcytosine-specific restriction endonuclease McrA